MVLTMKTKVKILENDILSFPCECEQLTSELNHKCFDLNGFTGFWVNFDVMQFRGSAYVYILEKP